MNGGDRVERKNEFEKCIEEYRLERMNLKKENEAEMKQEMQPVFCEKLNFLVRNQL